MFRYSHFITLWKYTHHIICRKCVPSSSTKPCSRKCTLLCMIHSTGDYVNSKEYRKPEWVTRMEEIQKKLDGKLFLLYVFFEHWNNDHVYFSEQTCSAKFTSEIKDLRVKEGQKAKFECAFAGNPPPDVVWEKDGKVLENSKEMQIKVKGGKTSLTIAECAMDMSGYFTVKIKNPLGSDRTRSSLTVSSKWNSEIILL